MKSTLTSWILRIIIVLIFAQTLPYKFAGAMESRELFTQLGIEPWGRFGIGFLELIACVLIIFQPTMIYGAILAWGLMAGALFAHATQLGFGGAMFPLALVAILAFIASSALLLLNRAKLPIVGGLFKTKEPKAA